MIHCDEQTRPGTTVIQPHLWSVLQTIDTALSEVLVGAVPSPWTLLDFPAHTNVGDSAIWLGALSLIEKRLGQRPSYVTQARQFPSRLRKYAPEGPILLLGGGNFGDLWTGHWEHRVNILRHFRGRKVVQLPQSIHFKDLNGRALHETREAIARHPNFTLMVRDSFSLDFATTHFECPVVLCPDFAYGLGQLDTNSRPHNSITALMRDDKERACENFYARASNCEVPVWDWVRGKKPDLSVRLVPKFAAKAPYFLGPLANPLERAFRMWSEENLARGVDLLDTANVVITDRLHGHILCSLMGKPHVVLDNSYGKNFGCLECWPDDGLTWSATDMREAVNIARSLAN